MFERFKRKDEPVNYDNALKPSADQILIDIKETEGQVITRETILEAGKTLNRYREGKASVENRIISNEQWWKGRHWSEIKKKDGVPVTDNTTIEPKSAWLFNCIMSKYADYIDAYPEANILPREINDQEEAKMLSSIVKVVLDQAGFEKTYSDEAWYKLKAGGGIYGIFWDSNKLNGLGDITISNIDILNFFWEPGVKNIQDSKNIFHTNLVDNETLIQMYPMLEGRLSGNSIMTAKYIYDDNIDTSEQSVVVDWYYKKIEDGKTKLHYVKFVNDVVLYATENDIEQDTQEVEVPTTNDNGEQIYKKNIDGFDEYLTENEMTETDMLDGGFEPVSEVVDEPIEGTSMAEKGLYEHGMYPFIIDNMFPVEGSIIGFSMIDICKSPQEDIDKIKQALLTNTLYAAAPRYFYRQDGQINEKQFKNPANMLVKVQGQIDADNLVPIPTQQLNGNYMNMLDMEINEMKETTGNTDVMSGIPTGVTSGSAISALQEAAGKTSRSQNKNAYMAYKEVVNMVIELIRQFYDIPRQFRILGENGEKEFVEYSNQNIKTQTLGVGLSGEEQYRLPVFDIEVVPQKQNPYSKNGQNETVMTLFGMGVFNPEMGDQAMALVESMDFNQKQDVIEKIKGNQMLLQQNEALKQQIMQLSMALDQTQGTHIAQDMATMFDAGEGQPMPQNGGQQEVNLEANTEHPFNQRARARVQESVQPQ